MNRKIVILGSILGLIGILLVIKPVLSPTITRPLWQVYQNSQYQFELSYPANWQREEWDIGKASNLKNVNDGTILYQGKFFGNNSSPTGEFEILIWENKSNASARNWLTWFRHEDLILKDVPEKENFSLAGLPTIRYLQNQTARKKPILYYFLGKDNKIYEFLEEREDLANNQASDSASLAHPVFDQILQSFKIGVK